MGEITSRKRSKIERDHREWSISALHGSRKHLRDLLSRTETLRHTREPVEEQRSTSVKDDVNPEQPEVAVTVLVRGRDAGKESVRLGDLAERAVACVIRVHERATGEADVVLEVLAASLAAWRVDNSRLDRGALGGRVSDRSREHAIDWGCTSDTTKEVA